MIIPAGTFSLSLLSQNKTRMKKKNVMLDGLANYNENGNFMFLPDDPVMGRVEKVSRRGIGLLLSDGTFDFSVSTPHRSRATLIKKVAHGRLSATIDGAIQLTLKIYRAEGVNIPETLRKEAEEAISILNTRAV